MLTSDIMFERFNECIRRYQDMTMEQVTEIDSLCHSHVSSYVHNTPPEHRAISPIAAECSVLQLGILQGMLYIALYGIPDFLKPMLVEAGGG